MRRSGAPRALAALLLCALVAGTVFAAAAAAPRGPASPPAAGVEGAPCTCLAAQATNGWCDKHAVGYVASIPIRSRMLYDSLDAHGHQVDLTSFHCDVCQKAIRTDGVCEEHTVGFVNKQAYFTRIAYELARAVYLEPSEIECPECRRNAASSGWCARHNVGMIGGFAMRDEAGWRVAARLAGVLRIAAKKVAECERCALAMAYDSDCPYHRIWYKDGKPIPPPPPPEGAPIRPPPANPGGS